jgi:hypothetical protein
MVACKTLLSNNFTWDPIQAAPGGIFENDLKNNVLAASRRISAAIDPSVMFNKIYLFWE